MTRFNHCMYERDTADDQLYADTCYEERPAYLVTVPRPSPRGTPLTLSRGFRGPSPLILRRRAGPGPGVVPGTVGTPSEAV
jgi:hypothetical protein